MKKILNTKTINMKILRQNHPNSSKKDGGDENRNKEHALTKLGKVSLGVSGAALGAAGIEYGRSIKNLADLRHYKEDLIKVANNKDIRKLGDQTTKRLPVYLQPVVGKVKGLGKDTIKFFKSGGWESSKFNTGVRAYKIMDRASMMAGRGVLKNAGNISRFAVEEGLRKNPGVLSKESSELVRRVIPGVTGKVGKSLLHFRNAKRVFTPIALAAGGLGFTSYAAGKGAEQVNQDRQRTTKSFSYQNVSDDKKMEKDKEFNLTKKVAKTVLNAALPF